MRAHRDHSNPIELKPLREHVVRPLIMCLIPAFVGINGIAETTTVRVKLIPQFAGKALVYDSLTNTSPTGQTISITRLDLLLSNMSLRDTNGVWVSNTNHVAFIRGRAERTSFVISNVPVGAYNRLKFNVGVPKELNHANPGALSPGDPLNPQVNGLHWSWKGGYVFLALEGLWKDENQKLNGYSFHLANDAMLTQIELPIDANVNANCQMEIGFDLDRIFSGASPVRLTSDINSTHSREGDELAATLRKNLQSAFAVVHSPIGRASTPTPIFVSSAGSNISQIIVSSNATPYRLTVPDYFPRPDLPRDNPITVEGIELGQRLFQEPLLSVNGSQSCASCHQSDAAFADRNRRASTGADGQSGNRRAMTLMNLAWKSSFFWDGRAATLREQVLQPIQNPIEMHETLTNVVTKLRNIADYPEMFEHAFGTTDISPDRISRALEQYLLIQVSSNSRFDRALRGELELADQEKRGAELFHTEYDPRRGQFGADCFHCHGGPLFRNVEFGNNGLDSEFKDKGRSIVTGRVSDEGKFAVPSLRNVSVTGPYMHDGRFKTLEEVVEHYSTGVKRSATLDPNIAKHPDGGLSLSEDDKSALVAFLRALTDERFSQSQPKQIQQRSESITEPSQKL